MRIPTMRAVTYHRYGPPSSAGVETIAVPSVGVREVRLRPAASATSPSRSQIDRTENADDLAVLRAMLEDSVITPLVSRVVQLDEVPAALADIGRGHTLGKLVARP